MLLFTACVSPYRIAFISVDSQGWIGIEGITDLIFAIDLILNFFFAHYNDHDELVDTRKKIAIEYLSSWFFIDLMTVLPISEILNSQTPSGNIGRLARLPKLYRLIKIIR